MPVAVCIEEGTGELEKYELRLEEAWLADDPTLIPESRLAMGSECDKKSEMLELISAVVGWPDDWSW